MMDRREALEKVLKAYEGYYNVKREQPEPPFAAEAEFRLHDENYFLVRSARIGEADSREFVYFAIPENLSEEELLALDQKAWENGLSRVQVHANHKNSDVVLVVLATHADALAMKTAKSLHHYKSYSWGFKGWSQYRLIVVDLSTDQVSCNRQGRDLRKIIDNTIYASKK